MNYEQTKRTVIVERISHALSPITPISFGYSGSLANGTVNEYSDIDFLLIILPSQIGSLIHHSQFRKYFQTYPIANPILQNFSNQKIDVIRASGIFASVRLNCEIYSVNSIRNILEFKQPQIKIIRKVFSPVHLKFEWISTDNFGVTIVFEGKYQKFYDSLLLTRNCFAVDTARIALGPDLDRILSGILVSDTHDIKTSINLCWKKIISIVSNSHLSFRDKEYNPLSRLFYNPPRFLPENRF